MSGSNLKLDTPSRRALFVGREPELGVLDDARLLKVEKQGRHRLYMVQPDALIRASNWLIELATERPDYTERPEWTTLRYATMENAAPPKKEDGSS